MPAFITRVELQNATDADYRMLPEQMWGKGFSKTITGGNNVEHLLPTKEYSYEGSVDINGIREAALSAVKVTGAKGEVFVAEYVRWASGIFSG